MTVAHKVEELLQRWQELRGQGLDVPAEELCRVQPELTASLAVLIQAIRQGEDTQPPHSAPPDTDGTRQEGPPSPPPSALPGGRYEVLGELGRGGMGVVYKARDTRTGRVVALKTMQSLDGASLELFKREFRYLQGVSHPNLVQLYELESDGNSWLLSMELVEGVDFLSHVRPDAARSPVEPSLATSAEEMGEELQGPPSPLHEARLRDSLGQLAEGIAALHAHRRAHRDLKPGNVRVTPDGRVAVLDFGLAADLGTTGQHLQTDQRLLGTFPYMAPEQFDTPPVSSPASDWYSVGVMLYKALTGRLPFTGNVLQMIRDKQGTDPQPPRRLCPGVPEDLDGLCMGMLRRRPEDRPAAAEILERLGRHPFTPPAGAPVAAEAPLLGRERHLAALREAYTASRREAVLVAVSGPSGVGKSALIRHFIDGLRAEGAAVLLGRCYEHESVPYKALDPIVDELGQYLLALPHEEAVRLLPRDVGPLVRVFPVLGRVEAVADAAARSTLSPDPHEVRRQAFAGLRELLAHVAGRQPLALYIDDLQWGDTDSVRLLPDLLQPPDSPPLLLLASYRSEDADNSCLRTLAQALGLGQAIDRRDLSVAPLTEAETRDLVVGILGREAERHAAGVYRESGGNPFFITELLQGIQSYAGERDGVPARCDVTLEALIQTRVGRLPEGAQRLLEVVAVSGRPLGEAEACLAAGAGADARTLLARLEAAKFVRGTQVAEEIRLETYHDRIRETVASALKPDVLRDCHGRLARVLEESGRGDHEEMAGHFEGAGELPKAGAYYGQAADRAAQALAFDHAAALYRKSLDLRPLEGAEARELRKKQGAALANAGRGAEAAPVFLAAVEGTEGREAFELRRQAADQYLVGGLKDEGLGVLETLLRSVGLSLASGKWMAMLTVIMERLWMRFRGLKFRERAVESIPAEQLMRVDVCETAAHRLSMLDAVQHLVFMAKSIRLTLDAGEPSRIAEAFMTEGFLTAAEGGTGITRGEEIRQEAMRLAHACGNPLVLAKASLWGGYIAWVSGKWKEGLTRFHSTEEIGVREHVLVATGITKLRHGMLDCLMMLGRWRDMISLLPGWLADARHRGDRFAISTMLVHSYVPCLAADRPDEAEAMVRQCREEWPVAGNVMGAYWGLFGRVEAAMYRGDGRGAWDLVRRERAALNRSTLFELMSVLNLIMVHLQARTALAAAAAEPASWWYFSPRPRLLRSAAGDAGRIERWRMPWSSPLAKLIRAGVANLRGNSANAATLLDAAEKEFIAGDMELYAAAARRQRGKLLGGAEGLALVASADAWMAGQDIRNPARITAMLAPGFAD